VRIIVDLKSIIRSIENMSSSLVLRDSFKSIVEETCKILKCDRASVFLIDYKKKLLWTKAAKGSDTIRMPMNIGLAGWVA